MPSPMNSDSPSSDTPGDTVTTQSRNETIADTATRPKTTQHGSFSAFGTDASTRADQSGPATELAPGAHVGRYRIRDELGAGGMGVVYRAYDPDLGREVALKLVHVHRSGQAAERAQTRLLREAQALARLAHPNVVKIYDVGTHEDAVYLAMELVEGFDLRHWLAHADRSWQEQLRVYVEAGKGLIAAHQVNLVHRDFKPANVIVGSDGRVRVLDFGLARAAAGSTMTELSGLSPLTAEIRTNDVSSASNENGIDHDDGHISGSLLNRTLTKVGSIMGTPAYMSPEQFAGTHTDARADQFSFCVGLYRALYGIRPYAGSSLAEIQSNIAAGSVTPPPETSPVPRALFPIVSRGLAADPDVRYASMEALVRALTRAVRRPHRRRGLALAAVILAISVGGVAWFAHTAAQTTPCAGSEQALAAVWNDARRDAMSRSLLATGRSYANTTIERVSSFIDGYGAEWVQARIDACEGTQHDAAQSELILDQRMLCLNRRLRALDGIVDTLSDAPTGAAVDNATRAIRALPAVADCADIQALSRAYPLPQDLALQRQIETLEAKHDRLEAMLTLGQLDGLVDDLTALVQRAEPLLYPPLLGRAHFALGYAYEIQGEHFDKAVHHVNESARIAALASDDELVARAMIRLLWIQVQTNTDKQAVLALRPGIEAALARAGDPPVLRADYLGRLGSILSTLDDLDEAERLLSEAFALVDTGNAQDSEGQRRILGWQASMSFLQGNYEQAGRLYLKVQTLIAAEYGHDHLWMATPLQNHANVLMTQSKHEEALAQYRRALALEEANRGAHTTYAALIRGNIGLALERLGRQQEARDMLESALAIERDLYGDEHAQVGTTSRFIATVLLSEGNYRAAKPYAETAVRLHRKNFGEAHPFYALSVQFLGRVWLGLGNYEKAHDLLSQSNAIYQATTGEANGNLSYGLVREARALAGLGRFDEAIAHAERAVQIIVEVHGEAHPNHAYVLSTFGRIELRRSNHRHAQALFAQALATLDAHSAAPKYQLATATLGLGRAYLGLNRVAAALPVLERAHEQALAIATAAHRSAPAKFHLARALWQSRSDAGRDRARARELAQEAHVALKDRLGEDAELRADIKVWLASR